MTTLQSVDRSIYPAQPFLIRILLVEDDPDQCSLYRLLLTNSGFEVVDVADGQQALIAHQTDNDSFDLLLADWGIPNISGDDLIRKIKDEDPLIRTILMSNHPDVRAVARECGADTSFYKPDLIGLIKVVFSVLPVATAIVPC